MLYSGIFIRAPCRVPFHLCCVLRAPCKYASALMRSVNEYEYVLYIVHCKLIMCTRTCSVLCVTPARSSRHRAANSLATHSAGVTPSPEREECTSWRTVWRGSSARAVPRRRAQRSGARIRRAKRATAQRVYAAY